MQLKTTKVERPIELEQSSHECARGFPAAQV